MDSRNETADADGQMTVHIERFGKSSLALLAPYEAREHARAFPDRRYWKPNYGERGAWIFAATTQNVQHALSAFEDATWSEAAAGVRDTVMRQLEKTEQLEALKRSGLTAPDYKFNTKLPPFRHQEEAFALSRDEPEFALLMEMGTGKTRVMVDTATHLRATGRINGVLVLCPNSVKDTWVEEVELMAPEWSSHETYVWSSHAKKKQRDAINDMLTTGPSTDALQWFIVNVEGLSSDRAYDVCERFLSRRDVLMIMDESTRIKSPKAKRTKAAVKLGKMARYRRIMTGTPVTQGPLDLYAQFKFLNHLILGFSSFYSFRNRYAVMGGFNMKQVVGYSNLEELTELVTPYSYRKLRRECVDLPPKVYERLSVPLSKEQREAYDQMRDDMMVELGEEDTVTATIVLTQLLRLQQIVGGFLPVIRYNELTMLEETEVVPLPGKNAKVEALLELIDDLAATDKVIIWARFRAEIDLIIGELSKRYGPDSVVGFHGGVSAEQRTEGRLAFQDPKSAVRFFVGQTETGGLGITLTAANTVVYYSNSFSLESRLQSEDRAHRIGQDKTVTYVDLLAENTLDAKVLATLRSKKNVADVVTGDGWRDWV